MKYDPRERRYLVEHEHLSPELGARIVDDARTLVRALGYDMNSIEFAVRDGVPYAIDFMNPAPDMDINSLTPHYFEWAVKQMADMAIRLAQEAAAAGEEMRWRRFRRQVRHRLAGVRHRRRHRRDRHRARTRSPPTTTCLTDELAAASRRRMLDDQLRPPRASSSATGRSAPCCGPRFMTPDAVPRCSSTGCGSLLRGVRQGPRARRWPTPRSAPSSGSTDWEERLIAARPRLPRAEPDLAARRVLHRRRRDHGASPSTTPRRPAGAGYNDALVDVVLRPAGHARVRAAATSACRCRRGTACCTRCSTPTSSGSGRREPPRHRHPRLARGADLQRVRAVPGLLPRGRASSASSPTRARWSTADGRLYAATVPGRPDLQARADRASWSSACGLGHPAAPGGARPAPCAW